MSRTIVILTTTAPPDAATAIADALVSDRLAACVQTAPVDSRYRWRGLIERAGEVRIEAKTVPRRVAAMVERVAALHSYEVPEIGWTEWTVSDAYGDWVEAETR